MDSTAQGAANSGTVVPMTGGTSSPSKVSVVGAGISASDDNEMEHGSLSPVPLGEFLKMELPPRKLLLSPWLPEKGLVMIYAPRGVGKTFLGLSVGLAVASAGRLLGWKADTPASVVYVDGEMPAADIQGRLKELIRGNPSLASARDFRLFNRELNKEGSMPDLSTTRGQEQLDAALPDNTKVVILDNLSSLISGDENDSAVWHPVQKWMLHHRAAGRSVVLIHHAGKKGLQRGTSRREDVLDTVLALKKPRNYLPSQGARFEIHFEKSRGIYGSDVFPFEAWLERSSEGSVWKKGRLTGTRELILELHRQNLSQAAIAKRLGINKSTVSRHIRALRESGSLLAES